MIFKKSKQTVQFGLLRYLIVNPIHKRLHDSDDVSILKVMPQTNNDKQVCVNLYTRMSVPDINQTHKNTRKTVSKHV
jgi:hypothetical protein